MNMPAWTEHENPNFENKHFKLKLTFEADILKGT